MEHNDDGDGDGVGNGDGVGDGDGTKTNLPQYSLLTSKFFRGNRRGVSILPRKPMKHDNIDRRNRPMTRPVTTSAVMYCGPA